MKVAAAAGWMQLVPQVLELRHTLPQEADKEDLDVEPSEKGILAGEVEEVVRSRRQQPARHQVGVQLKNQDLRHPEPGQHQPRQQEEEQEEGPVPLLYYKDQNSKRDHSFSSLVLYISSVYFMPEIQ